MTIATGELSTVETALANDTATVNTDFESDTPDVETQAYRNMKTRSRKTRDLMKGVEAIRAGTTLYLPMLPAESLDRYNARRTIAALFNGYKATVKAAVGLILQTPPVLGPDMPQRLVDMAENVDGKGTHLDVFTRQLTQAGINDGLAGIITEYPRANDPSIDRSKASLAATIALDTGEQLDASDEVAMGMRPYFILVKSDNVLFPVYETVNGKNTLVMIVFLFSATERKGRFGQKTLKTWRVYSLERGVVMYELWKESENGKAERTEGPTAMRNITAIPWSPLPVGEEIGPNEYMPTLYDLAELNITHHRIASGGLSLIERAYVPTMVRIGAEPDANGKYPTVIVGPDGTIEAPQQDGVTEPIYYLSPPTDVLDPGFKALETCKAEMGAMGMSFLAPDPRAAETATAERRDNAAEKATISSVSRAVQDCLESAFGFGGDFVREKAGSVAVNREFEELTMDSAMMSAYTALAEAGFPKKWIVIALQNGGRISPDADPDKIVTEWDAKAATMEAEKEIARQISIAGTLPDETDPEDPKKKPVGTGA